MTESVGRRVCAILEEVALSDGPEMSHPFCDIQWRRWLRFLVVNLGGLDRPCCYALVES